MARMKHTAPGNGKSNTRHKKPTKRPALAPTEENVVASRSSFRIARNELTKTSAQKTAPPTVQMPLKKKRRGLPTAKNRPKVLPPPPLPQKCRPLCSLMTQGEGDDFKTIEEFTKLCMTLQSNAKSANLSQRFLEAGDDTSIYCQVEDFAHWARSDLKLYNDQSLTERINTACATNDQCRRDKERTIARMHGFLEFHPNAKMRLLCEWLDDPEQIGMEERRLVALIRGLKNINKQTLLNAVLTIFSVNMHKVSVDKETLAKADKKEIANAKHKPGSLQTCCKHIFSHLKNAQVNCTMNDFKNIQGSFHAALKMDFEATLEERPDCGNRQCAPADLLAAQKVRAAGLNPFRLSMLNASESGCDHSLMIVAHSMGELFMLRGGKEPAGPLHSSFHLDVQVGGEFNGVECLRLDGFGASANGDKTMKLSLGNPCTRDASGCHKICANEADDFCLIKLFKFYTQNHLIPAMKEIGETDHRFFVRRAPMKILKPRFAKGIMSEAGMHKNQHWGESHFPQKIRELAIRCKFDDAERHTMRSSRRVGMSVMAKSTLGTANVQKAARHQSVQASRLHQVEDESDHVARSRVFHANTVPAVEFPVAAAATMAPEAPVNVAPKQAPPQVQQARQSFAAIQQPQQQPIQQVVTEGFSNQMQNPMQSMSGNSGMMMMMPMMMMGMGMMMGGMMNGNQGMTNGNQGFNPMAMMQQMMGGNQQQPNDQVNSNSYPQQQGIPNVQQPVAQQPAIQQPQHTIPPRSNGISHSSTVRNAVPVHDSNVTNLSVQPQQQPHQVPQQPVPPQKPLAIDPFNEPAPMNDCEFQPFDHDSDSDFEDDTNFPKKNPPSFTQTQSFHEQAGQFSQFDNDNGASV